LQPSLTSWPPAQGAPSKSKGQVSPCEKGVTLGRRDAAQNGEFEGGPGRITGACHRRAM